MSLLVKPNWRCIVAILFCLGVSRGADLQSAKAAYDQKDYATALEQFTALAENGDANAQLFLGKMYMTGQGAPKDSEQALHWLKASAVQGNADAQFFVGAMYLLPQKDIGEGLKWLRISAEQGMQDAQYLLGKAYMRGAEQLPRDPVQGAMWLRLATKENKQFYLDELQSAERQMTPNQVARAKKLADEWKPNSSPAALVERPE
jgi:TPR repeat protein